MQTTDDRDILKYLGMSSIPCNWTSTHDQFPRVNHYAGQQAKAIIDRTLNNIRRHGTSQNQKVVRLITSAPELYNAILENMSVISAKEKGAYTPEDMKTLLGRALHCLEHDEPLPKDISSILARDIREYLMDNPHNKTLGQCLGLEEWKSKPKNIYEVPYEIVEVIDLMVFDPQEFNGQLRYPDFKKAWEICRARDADTWCDQQKIDLDEYLKLNNNKYPKGSCKSRTFYETNFENYKYLALDYILRDRCTFKPFKVKLNSEQLAQVKKYWDADLPEVCQFVEEESGSPSEQEKGSN